LKEIRVPVLFSSYMTFASIIWLVYAKFVKDRLKGQIIDVSGAHFN